MRQFDYVAQTHLVHQQQERAAYMERKHLIREALAGQRISFYRPLLISVGRRLEKFGAELQVRAAVNLELSAATPNGHSGTFASDTPC